MTKTKLPSEALLKLYSSLGFKEFVSLLGLKIYGSHLGGIYVWSKEPPLISRLEAITIFRKHGFTIFPSEESYGDRWTCSIKVAINDQI